MKKKLIWLMMTAVLCTALCIGCGKDEAGESSSSGKTETVEETVDENSNDNESEETENTPDAELEDTAAEEPDTVVAAVREIPDPVDIAQANAGDVVVFGSYEQDNDTGNGAEPIKWFVLDKSDGQLLLLAVDILDAQKYNENSGKITWEECSLRSWLNEDFYNTAFNADEQAKITESNLVNGDNPYYFLDGDTYVAEGDPIEGGNDTTDKIFILSYEEIGTYLDVDLHTYYEFHDQNAQMFTEERYEFDDIYQYCGSVQDPRMLAAPTAYALENGAAIYSGGGSELFDYATGLGLWWVREPGKTEKRALYVKEQGYVELWGADVEFEKGVRPAMRIVCE